MINRTWPRPREEHELLDVAVERVGEVVVCCMEGDADMATAATLREALHQLIAERRVVLDFSGVTFIDSAGLACLVAGARRVNAANGMIVVASPCLAVQRLFTTIGMERTIPVAGTIDDAIALLDVASRVAVDANEA